MSLNHHKGPREPVPLTPADFHILLALADEPKHGYAIMKQVDCDGGRSLRMGPGTFYGSLQSMVAAGLVEEIEGDDDERRRYYRMTGPGQRALDAELARLRWAPAAARKTAARKKKKDVSAAACTR